MDEAWIDEVLESPSDLSHRESRREKPPAEAEVIDVDADDATLAEQLSKRLNHEAEVLGLAALHAARERRAARRSAVPAHADVVDVEDRASTDLLHEQRERLPSFLHESAQQLPFTDVYMNPHSLPGTPLYERFFAAWARVPDKSMRLVFHGTPEKNIDAICREGLDPNRRRGQALGPGEYFGGQPMISLGYCKGGHKMLVFCILTDPSGVTSLMEDSHHPYARDAVPGVAVIHKPEHQLPLAVVTFDPERMKQRRPAILGKKAAKAARAAAAAAALQAAAAARAVDALGVQGGVRTAAPPAAPDPQPDPAAAGSSRIWMPPHRRHLAPPPMRRDDDFRRGPIPMRRIGLMNAMEDAAPAPMPPPPLRRHHDVARPSAWGKRRRDEVDERRRDEDDEDDELQRALKLSMRRQVDERKEDDEMRRAIALSMRVF